MRSRRSVVPAAADDAEAVGEARGDELAVLVEATGVLADTPAPGRAVAGCIVHAL